MAQPLPSGVAPGPLIALDGYIYTIGGDNNLYKLSTTVAIPNGTATPFLYLSGVVGPQFMITYSNATTGKTEMYISAVGNNNNGSGTIYIIPDLDNPSLEIFASGLNSPRGLGIYEGHLYVITVTNTEGTYASLLMKISLTDSDSRENFNLGSTYVSPEQLVIVSNTIYIINTAYQPNAVISKFSIASNFGASNYFPDWLFLNDNINNNNPGEGLVYNGGYLYFIWFFNGGTTSQVRQITITQVGSVTNNNVFPSLEKNAEFFQSLVFLNNQVYIDYYAPNYSIYGLPFNSNIICFKQDTKILCHIDGVEQYIPVQTMKKGTLVKTLNKYIPVDIVGSSKVYNSGNNERILNRLYRLPKENYPSLNEDLVMTGGHCSLIDIIPSYELRQKLIETQGALFLTEGKYRLPALLDEKAIPYEEVGTFTIWNFALENKNQNSNYGIYANGLLVESGFYKSILKKMSNAA